MFSGRNRGVFADQFRCHSVSLLAAEQQRDPARLEYSDKIILPPSCLEKLAHLEITYPMIFEITNPRYLARRLHCAPRPGRLRFSAPAAQPRPPCVHACDRVPQVASSSSLRRRAWCTFRFG